MNPRGEPGMLRAGGGLIVDCHMHIMEPNWNPNMADGLEGLSASWARQVRWYYGPKADPRYLLESIANCWDGSGEKTIARMDEAGVDCAVMMPMDHSWALGEEGVIPISEKNRLCLELTRRHRGRLFSFCGVDPRRPDALDILREGLEGGALGLKLYPTNGFYPDDPVCYPLYELCGEHDAPVLFHTGHSAGRQKSKYGHPIYIDSVAADFPDLRLVMGHSGRVEAWGQEALAVAVYKTNTYLDLSLWQHWLSPDELLRKVVWIRDRVGIDRLLFGSDMVGIDVSLTLGEWVEMVRQLPEWANQAGYRLTPDEIDMVLGENARRCYRIPDEAREVKSARSQRVAGVPA
jgi:predicted TIM-barrel fold metal-dependent hydrolase